MDEELGVKAPVTRLRRRLSTEAEGAQSPLTPSTPTKKRGARIAKPALELIDENVTETVPKKITRRASVKDVEPTEEKPVTPSRRSSRMRSNTSLLLEATQNSAVAESPRAKRALRRNSQIGQTSDTETATTPARRTRARRDSTSSVEKLGATSSNEKVIAPVAETISEEPEKEISKETKLDVSQNSTPIRKSPRLNKKNGNDNTENDNEPTEPKLTEDKSSQNELNKTNEVTLNTHDETDNKTEPIDSRNLSPDSTKLINEINTNPNKPKDFNKTTPATEPIDDKANRKRTKSWTTITGNDRPSDNILNGFATGDSIALSVNIESSNKSKKLNNISMENKENIETLKPGKSNETMKILESTPTKDIKSVVLMEDSDSDVGKLTMDIDNKKDQKNYEEDQCVPVVKQATPKRSTSESFVAEPMDIDETIPENVTFNDFSDKSNSSKEDNQIPDSKQNSSKLNENHAKSTSSNSFEQESNKPKRKSSITASQGNDNFKVALDRSSVFEKSPRKLSTSVLYENDNHTKESNKSKRKSSLSKVDSDNDKRKLSISKEENKINDSVNKSKRKSVSDSETQNTEKTSNENKSTLVLSQLKDVSTNETSNASKSPNDTNNELSNSVNIPTKETDKKNNYLTSTPLHQKPLQKLAMQINTSVISPNVNDKNFSKTNKSKTPVKKSSDINNASDSSEESDDDSREKHEMVDDEAKEASDSYESGDSRDAEEIQYEKDHEITEKGETLESEPDEDDSEDDYEKDSFVVSSDEEDNNLLSDSGDDLSLTDNELKMTAKSKKKFDKRKLKEQKNASREMYEARHQLDKSNKSSESKKSKSKKIESSSDTEEEKEPETKSKKKNRLRIDSSQDVSMNNSDADESVGVIKKKSKRLSESVCEYNPNEKEVTILNETTTEKQDPLAVAVKKEPKTPQKDFNMSTVLINDNIEQVEVDTNASIMKSNETSDPLQATLAHDDEESDSDISENMEIKENYDSVLENLNKANKQKVKTRDVSLDLNKKGKDKAEPIIDQLNLTQTKKSKKTKTHNDEDHITEKSAKLDLASEIKNDDDNSDSIDVRLLFPEDSYDSEVNASKFKPDTNEESSDKDIPLKKTEAKTNLRDTIDGPEESLSFFIDTKGTYEDNMDDNISIQTSSKKKNKKRKQNISTDNLDAEDNVADPEEISINISQKKDKKQKKNKSLNVSQKDSEPVMNLLDISSRYEQSNIIADETDNNTTNSGKKKKKNKSHNGNVNTEEFSVPEETSMNVSVGSQKKKKNKFQDFQINEVTVAEETSMNVSVGSQKKKKLQDFQINEVTASEETPANISVNSDKKKKKNKSQLDNTQNDEAADPEETSINISVNSQKKKKKKDKSLENVQNVEDTAPEEISINLSMNSNKKKKKNKSFEVSHENIASAEETVANVSRNSDKKKNKPNSADEIQQYAEPIGTEEVSPKRKKKNKKVKPQDVSQTVDNTGDDSDEAPMEVAYKSEKKSDNPEPVENEDTLNKSKNKFKKRKKKNKKRVSQTDQDNMNTDQGDVRGKKRKYDQTTDTDGEDQLSKKNKRKISQNDESGNSVQGGSTSKPKKRKATEDDQKNSKVFKRNIFEKIHVPRLPESIVNQLDEQPALNRPKSESRKKKKKKKAISTVPFVVEEGIRRKNKPSNYLEQSVYLNDSVSPVKKKKKIKNPKVLPFTPTVVTSGTGYTSKFKINVLPEETQFVAQAKKMKNFREIYLSKHRAKKLKLECHKKQRNPELTKF